MDFESGSIGIDSASALIQPEIITPTQWQGMHLSRQLDGEHKLMLAIFLNGIREYQGKLGLKVTEQARDWVNSHEEGIFAFDFLCSEFRLDPDFIRAKLAEYSLKGKRIRVVQPPVIEKHAISSGRRGRPRKYEERSGSPCLKDPAYVERQRVKARERYRLRYREITRQKRVALRAELEALKEERAAS